MPHPSHLTPPTFPRQAYLLAQVGRRCRVTMINLAVHGKLQSWIRIGFAVLWLHWDLLTMGNRLCRLMRVCT